MKRKKMEEIERQAQLDKLKKKKAGGIDGDVDAAKKSAIDKLKALKEKELAQKYKDSEQKQTKKPTKDKHNDHAEYQDKHGKDDKAKSRLLNELEYIDDSAKEAKDSERSQEEISRPKPNPKVGIDKPTPTDKITPSKRYTGGSKMKLPDFSVNPDGGPVRIPKGYKFEYDEFSNK